MIVKHASTAGMLSTACVSSNGMAYSLNRLVNEGLNPFFYVGNTKKIPKIAGLVDERDQEGPGT